MNTVLEMRFNRADDASYQVIKLLSKGSGYAVSFQAFNGDVGKELLERVASKMECETLLEKLMLLTIPVANQSSEIRLGGFTELSINCSFSSARFYWGATPPGWEPLDEFAGKFASLVSKQFGSLFYV